MSQKNYRSNRWNARATCVRVENDLETKQGLAITPSTMAKMAAQGIPVSAQNSSLPFTDGEPNPSWDLPFEEQRGIDVAEVWQQTMSTKTKFRKAHQDKLSQQKNTSQN